MNVNETIEIKSLVSRGHKKFTLAMASRRVGLSGNASLIATFLVVCLRYTTERADEHTETGRCRRLCCSHPCSHCCSLPG